MSKARNLARLIVDSSGDVDSSALDNAPNPITVIDSDPSYDSNGTLGDLWLNTTSGELFALTDATADQNVWKNIGDGTGGISNLGLVSTNPADSAKALYELGRTSGNYYVNNIWTGNVTRLVYCELGFDYKGAGTLYHLQRFHPAHLSGYSAYNCGPSTSTTTITNLSDSLDNNTDFSFRYETYSSGTGAAIALKSSVAAAQTGQVFIRIDQYKGGSGDGSNPVGEGSITFDNDTSGDAYVSAQVSASYSTNYQTLPNQFTYMSAGFLLPANAGIATFTLNDVVAAYDNNTTSIALARSNLGSASATAHTPQAGTVSITTGYYWNFKHQGWSDTGTIARSSHMYWVAAEI